MNPIIDLVNKRSLKKSIPDVRTGDVVRVSQKITEGAKSRVQIFEGMVISREGGNGVTASITVRKIASGVGVEKKFILNSPNIEGVKVLRSSKVRRKKIFFLRGLTGKAAKIKEKQRKMLGEIGLREDEVESAENTEDLAQPIIEDENNESGITNNEEEKNTESPVTEVTEEKEEVAEVPQETIDAPQEEIAAGEIVENSKDEKKED
jgi:large subunit ribosomal protein L19